MYKQERNQNEIIAENILRLMRQKGWSQNELGRKLGLSATAVNKWCRGITSPRNDQLDNLCKLFGVQRSEILSDNTAIQNLSIPAAHPVPMLGLISAGNGILADESFDGYFFVDNSIRADYCLRVEGDSMIEAGINHGDIAFLRKSYSFLDGEIYAVVFGEDKTAVLKKVYRQGDKLVLSPCNQRYSPITVDDALIVGECVGVYHPR